MNAIRLHVSVVLLVGLVGACASGGSQSGGPSAESYGTFQFREVVNNTLPPVVLEGQIEILPDTIVATLVGAPCQYENNRQTSLAIVYNCMGTILSIDRRNPARRARYSVVTTRLVSERVCVRYAEDENGNRRCVQWGLEYREVPEHREGTLSLL